jgi:HEAT repeat protein
LSDVNLYSSHWPAPLTDEAKTAVAHIGTNAIPFLVKWMEGGSFSSFLDAGAVQAFHILGPSASSAIPDLARLATNQVESTFRVSTYAQLPVTMYGYGPLRALGSVGPDALPILLSILTNSIAPGTRLGAIGALMGMGTNAGPLAPVFIKYVDDENEMVASAAVRALGSSGAGNREVLAVLETVADGPRPTLRSSALDALSQFGDQSIPALVRALGGTNQGNAMLAFHRLAFIVPMAITNSNILKIAATRLQSQDADWQEWAAYVLRAIGQQASGMKPDFMSPISRHDLMREDATNLLRRLAPELLVNESSR